MRDTLGWRRTYGVVTPSTIFLMPLARSVIIPFLMAPSFSSAVDAPWSTISLSVSLKRMTS